MTVRNHSHPLAVRSSAIAVGLTLALGASLLMAEAINPPTKPQTSPAMTAQEQRNLEHVLNWWREVIQGGHMELTSKYQADDYIQHNPNVPTGRAAFVSFFQNVRRREAEEPDSGEARAGARRGGAKGDFVFLCSSRSRRIRATRRRPIIQFVRDAAYRERQGAGALGQREAAWRRPPGAPKPAPFEQPPSQHGDAAAPARCRRTRRRISSSATIELKDMLQYGHLELADKVMDPGYIQHNPNVPQGRDGFKQFMSRTPGRTPQRDQARVGQRRRRSRSSSGPYVVMMWDRKDKDPNDASQEYVWNHFDVVRIENGLIKEHWDEAVVAAPAAAPARSRLESQLRGARDSAEGSRAPPSEGAHRPVIARRASKSCVQ